MSDKRRNNNGNNSYYPLTSRRTDGNKGADYSEKNIYFVLSLGLYYTQDTPS